MSDYVNNKVDGDLMEASDLEAIETASATKSNKILSATSGNVIEQDASGDLVDSGVASANLLVDADIGSDVQAYDAGLQSISGLTTAADKMIYTSGSDVYVVTDLTAFARTFLDDANAGAVRTTIGAVGLTGAETIAGAKEFTSELVVTNTAAKIALKDSDTGNYGIIEFRASNDSVNGFFGFDSQSNNDITLQNENSTGNIDINPGSSSAVRINGNYTYHATGTDVPITDGGTGSSTVAGALINFGIETKAKPSLTSRSSTTTLTSDPDLAGWTIPVDTRVKIEGFLKVISPSSTPDLKLMLNASVSTQEDMIHYRALDLSENETLSGGIIGNTEVFPVVVAVSLGVYFTGFLVSNASTETTLDIDWAQNVSDANSVNILEGSWMTVTVNP